MSKQGQTAENKQSKDHKPAKVEQPVTPALEELPGYAEGLNGVRLGAADEGGAEDQAEQDYWNEHSIVDTLYDWGLGDKADDHNFKVFKRALNAHVDGKMQPLFGFSASWVNG